MSLARRPWVVTIRASGIGAGMERTGNSLQIFRKN